MSPPPNDLPASRPARRRGLKIVFGFLVTLAALASAVWLMTRGDDPQELLSRVGAAFRRADYRTIPLIWGVLLVFYWLKARRWAVLLSPIGRFSPGECFRSILIGFSFNNLLPARIGEFVRIFVFARRHRLSNTAVLSTVALERILDSVAIFAIFLVGLPLVPHLPPDVEAVVLPFAVLVGVGLAGAAVYLIWTQPFVRLVEAVLNRMPFLPEGLRGKVTGILTAGAEGLASLRSGRTVAKLAVNSLVQWILNALQMGICLWAFDIAVSPWVACVLMGIVAVGVAVPQAPGYFGTMQLLWVLVINEKTVGVADKEAVFAASIYYQVVQYTPVTLLGLYYFNRTGLSMSEMQAAAEEKEVHHGDTEGAQRSHREREGQDQSGIGL